MAGKTHFTRSGTAQYGVSTYGISPQDISGNIFWVDSVNGTASGPGYTPEQAFTTLALGVAACTASNGDAVFLAPGHTQTITSAALEGCAKAGIRIIGIGRGRNRPVFLYSTAVAASFDVTAANVTIQNVVFRGMTAIDAVTAMVNVSGADVWFDNCEFELADSTYQAVLGILTTAAANRLRITNCHFHGTVDAGCESAIKLVGGDSAVIENSYFNGAFATTGAIQNATTAATNLVIARNTILNQTADGNNKTIVLHASGTGLIAGNLGGIIDSTGPAPVTAAAAWVAGNYWSSAVGVTASVLM